MNRKQLALLGVVASLAFLALLHDLHARGRGGGGFRGGGGSRGGFSGGMRGGGMSRPSFSGGSRSISRAPVSRTPSFNRSPSFSRPRQPVRSPIRPSTSFGSRSSMGSRTPGAVQFPRSGSAGSRIGDRQIGSIDRTPANRLGDRQIGAPGGRVGDRQIGAVDRTPGEIGRAHV